MCFLLGVADRRVPPLPLGPFALDWHGRSLGPSIPSEPQGQVCVFRLEMPAMRGHAAAAPGCTAAGRLAWSPVGLRGPLPTRVTREGAEAGTPRSSEGSTAQICAARAEGSPALTAQLRVGSRAHGPCAWPPSQGPLANQAQETRMFAASRTGLGRLLSFL